MSKYKLTALYKVDMRSAPDQDPVFSFFKGEEIRKDLFKDIIETKAGYTFINPIKLNVASLGQALPSNCYFIHDHKNDQYQIVKSAPFSGIVHLVELLNTFTTDINKISDLDKTEIFRLEFEDNMLEKNEVESLGEIPQDAIVTQ